MNLRKYTVLYAEDEQEIRKLYADVLKNYFDYVYEVSNGVEALEIYYKYKPDLLILDINMPILNGLEVAEKLRSQKEECKIIILSAMIDTNILLKACELYLVKYLVKPIKTLELDTILKQVIEEINIAQGVKIFSEADRNFKFDYENMGIIDGKTLVKLSRKEFLLIKILIKMSGEVISCLDLINQIWENDYNQEYDPNKLRVLIYRLNKKFSTEIVLSSYNEGYYLCNKF